MKEEDIEKTEDIVDDIILEPEDGEGNNQTLSDKNKKVREELKMCLQEKNEYLTGWQRAKADYINLSKEAEEKFRTGMDLGKTRMVESILPALDSFDMAMANKEVWESIDQKWRTGVEYIKTQLLSGLSESGIMSFGETGDVFDPNLHESIETIKTEDDKQNNLIASVIQKGYKTEKGIIRPARVKVYGN